MSAAAEEEEPIVGATAEVAAARPELDADDDEDEFEVVVVIDDDDDVPRRRHHSSSRRDPTTTTTTTTTTTRAIAAVAAAREKLREREEMLMRSRSVSNGAEGGSAGVVDNDGAARAIAAVAAAREKLREREELRAIAAVAAAREELREREEDLMRSRDVSNGAGGGAGAVDNDGAANNEAEIATTTRAIAAVAAAREKLREREEELTGNRAVSNGADNDGAANAEAEIREAAKNVTVALAAFRGLLQRQIARNNDDADADSGSAARGGEAAVLDDDGDDNDNARKRRRKRLFEIDRAVDGDWDSPDARARAAFSVSAAESALAALEPLLVSEANDPEESSDADADADDDVDPGGERTDAGGAQGTLRPKRGGDRGLGLLWPQTSPAADDDQLPRRLFRGRVTPALDEAYRLLDAAVASRSSADFRLSRTYRTLFVGAWDQLRRSAKDRRHWDEEVARRAEVVRRAELAEPCSWNRKLERLRRFREEHGHAHPSRRGMRTKRTSGRTMAEEDASDEGDEALDDEQNEDQEQDHSLDQRRQSYNGETESRDKDNWNLAEWVDTQRDRYKRGLLAPQRARALEELGVKWSGPREAKWKKFYEELVVFREAHGHCDVPREYPPNPKLSEWVQKQKLAESLMKKKEPSHMTQERRLLLNEIGFTWAVPTASWDERFEELVRYREAHGHCRVPYNYKPNPQLANWVRHMRSRYFVQKRGVVNAESRYLTEERKSLLDSVGFEWSEKVKSWDERFDELCAFQVKYRKAAPTRGDNKTLALWVRKQRMYFRKYREGKPAPVTDEQIEKLVSIGIHSWE